MSSPAVTIALPVFNGGLLIRRAIESVLKQDFADLELIISDNASTDDTAVIAAEYAAADPRVRHERREQKCSALENFERALSLARGQAFSWIAHDDFYERNDHVSRLVEKIREGNTLAFPDVHTAHLDEKGTILRTHPDSLAAFADICTRMQLVREAIRRPSVQIYGLYRTDKLREYLRIMFEDRDMLCFFEGRFIQSVLLSEPWQFVPEARLIIGQHATNSSKQQPQRLLRDYLVYSARMLSMYRRNLSFTRLERLMIYTEIVRAHAPYAMRLTASVIKRRLLRS